MPDSIFHEGRRQGIAFSVLFCFFCFFVFVCCLLFIIITIIIIIIIIIIITIIILPGDNSVFLQMKELE